MKNNGVKFGLFYGISAVIISVISYLINSDHSISLTSWSSILSSILMLGFMFLASKKTRDQNGGSLPFGEALVPAFITFVIGSFMSSIYMYVLINYIDPSLLDSLNEFGLEAHRSGLEMAGLSEDKILEQLEDFEGKQSNEFTLLGSITNYLSQLVMGLPISAIIAAIVKKKEPIIHQP